MDYVAKVMTCAGLNPAQSMLELTMARIAGNEIGH